MRSRSRLSPSPPRLPPALTRLARPPLLLLLPTLPTLPTLPMLPPCMVTRPLALMPLPPPMRRQRQRQHRRQCLSRRLLCRRSRQWWWWLRLSSWHLPHLPPLRRPSPLPWRRCPILAGRLRSRADSPTPGIARTECMTSVGRRRCGFMLLQLELAYSGRWPIRGGDSGRGSRTPRTGCGSDDIY